MPEWHVVCEVSDGVEAVKRAEELKPDIILMDVGLPKLNGIEAARQISKTTPSSRILFLSAFDSHDVVEGALRTGASGYAVKLDAANELVGAVEAVLEGKQFISSRLRGAISPQTESTHVSDKHASKGLLTSHSVLSQETEFVRCHEVLFYSDDGTLLEGSTHFIGAALRFGNGAIVCATKPHRDVLLKELRAQGLDPDPLMQRGAFLSLDAAQTLSTFMIHDWPDADRFVESFKNLIESVSKAAKAKHPRVAIFGEGCALLWEGGERESGDFGSNNSATILLELVKQTSFARIHPTFASSRITTCSKPSVPNTQLSTRNE